jgi:alpha-N-arabinofuranosidase
MHPVQATGHGDFVQAHDSTWWFVFLGKRSTGFEVLNSVLGRETFLSPVKWLDNGWPVIGNNGHVEINMEAPDFLKKQNYLFHLSDEFNDKKLSAHWNYIRYPEFDHYKLKNGKLLLTGSEFTLDDAQSPTFAGIRQKEFNCSVTTKMSFDPQENQEEAGLTIYMEEANHYEIAIKRVNNKNNLVVKGRVGNLQGFIYKKAIETTEIFIRIESTPEMYRFLWSPDGKEYKFLAELNARYLQSPQFTGAYFGLYATGNGKQKSKPAEFEWFEYKEKL